MEITLRTHNKYVVIVPWLFVFLWSTGFIGAKYALAYSEPYFLLFLRGGFSCVSFAILSWVMKVEWPNLSIAFKHMKAGFMLQAMFGVGCFTAISLGMPASITSLIVGMQPILTALIVTLAFKKSFQPQQWLGLMLGFLGVFLVLNPVASHDYELTTPAIIGSVIGLIGITTGTLYQKKINTEGHPIAQIFFQQLSLVITAGILTLGIEDQQAHWNVNFVFALAWLVTIVGVGATLLLMYMIKNGESTKVATYFYLVPVFTAFESWMLFGKTISYMGFVGMAVSITGLLLVVRYSKGKQR
ncbi:DMT family transporter [Pseudoalteromonas sp. 2CM28B]|uniref:DMT family transporter n=1 Tax=Pseudoalteromonas sp. 2CM28B TaxID=2929851 RepID=UPI0020BE1895|nr:DMT family transporter [Pseudoalteromonas sp. 2CM28B]MCK8131352.1 DMT family transporter [Pseudoalteromonas sp. 2CM28B]